MRFVQPENYFEVSEALIPAEWPDLVSEGCDCFILPRW